MCDDGKELLDDEAEEYGWRVYTLQDFPAAIQGTSRAQGFRLHSVGAQACCPVRLEGSALKGKKITLTVPARYCQEGKISRYAPDVLASEGFCGFVERSHTLSNCTIKFAAGVKNQWKIKVED